jgi:hypothetical protein
MIINVNSFWPKYPQKNFHRKSQQQIWFAEFFLFNTTTTTKETELFSKKLKLYFYRLHYFM